jgi:hypothetical protein
MNQEVFQLSLSTVYSDLPDLLDPKDLFHTDCHCEICRKQIVNSSTYVSKSENTFSAVFCKKLEEKVEDLVICVFNKIFNVHEFLLIRFSEMHRIHSKSKLNQDLLSDDFLLSFLNKVTQAHQILENGEHQMEIKHYRNRAFPADNSLYRTNLDRLFSTTTILFLKSKTLDVVDLSLDFLKNRSRLHSLLFLTKDFTILIVHFVKKSAAISMNVAVDFDQELFNLYKIKMIQFGQLTSSILLAYDNIRSLEKHGDYKLPEYYKRCLNIMKLMFYEEMIHWNSILEVTNEELETRQ